LHLAEAIAGQTVNEAGVFEETKLNRMETIHQIRELVNRQSPTDDWVEWGRWLLADPATRTISPFCEPTLAKYIEARLEDLDTASLDAAARAAGQSETLLKLIADTRAALEWTGKAQVLEQEGNLTEAVDAWSQALALSGEGRHQLGTWYLTRGRLHARLERWSEAADDLMQARRLNPQDIWPWQQLAPLLIKTGEVEEYRQHREAMLANFGATGGPGVDGKTVKVFTLLPAPAGPSLTSVAKIASRAVAQGQASPHLAYIQATKGVADYREGHFAQAAEWSEKALANRRKGNSALEAQILNAQAYPVLAMARYQLNQTEPAREALRKAKEIAEQNLSKRISDPGFPWNDLLVAEIFLNEAKALIEGQESAAAR
jgi:tetratricopeptide (TPR) repeat protein